MWDTNEVQALDSGRASLRGAYTKELDSGWWTPGALKALNRGEGAAAEPPQIPLTEGTKEV